MSWTINSGSPLGSSVENAEITDATIKGTKFYPDHAESDTVGDNNTTERTTTNTSYVLLKETEITGMDDGTVLRVKFSGKNVGSNLSYGRVYINDIAVGTERMFSGTYTEYSQDFTINNGDKVQVYGRVSGASTTCYVKDLNLCFDLQPQAPTETATYTQNA